MAKVKSQETQSENTAQNTGTAPEGTAPAAAKPAPAPRNIKYTYQKDPAEGQKFAPQANLILKHIRAAGADGITKVDLEKALAADADFKTRQPIGRIIGYYQKDLVNAGLITQGKAD